MSPAFVEPFTIGYGSIIVSHVEAVLIIPVASRLTQRISVYQTNPMPMQQVYYECSNCGTELSYQVTKHKGCENCGYLPAHSAD